ncbi:MAG: hypothetical protein Q9200_004537 [Gallowayella weberi]
MLVLGDFCIFSYLFFSPDGRNLPEEAFLRLAVDDTIVILRTRFDQQFCPRGPSMLELSDPQDKKILDAIPMIQHPKPDIGSRRNSRQANLGFFVCMVTWQIDGAPSMLVFGDFYISSYLFFSPDGCKLPENVSLHLATAATIRNAEQTTPTSRQSSAFPTEEQNERDRRVRAWLDHVASEDGCKLSEELSAQQTDEARKRAGPGETLRMALSFRRKLILLIAAIKEILRLNKKEKEEEG